ncbi:MAG: hypothetical protein KAS32_17630 [Candidatus Peribacteraceae bacterium]|nr:hypothetical protein [Candidatus Peribacteraceae bacterium]
MEFDLNDWWHEIIGYSVGAGAWFWNILPATCEDWTHVFALLIVSFTFTGITLPKIWDFQCKRWRKYKKRKLK